MGTWFSLFVAWMEVYDCELVVDCKKETGFKEAK